MNSQDDAKGDQKFLRFKTSFIQNSVGKGAFDPGELDSSLYTICDDLI